MEYTTMVLPSSLREEEVELLSVGTLNDQPFARAPCATLYSGGQGYNGHMRPRDTNYTPKQGKLTKAETLDFAPDCSRWDSTTLYLVLLGL
jgi:hypothetical protein